MALISALPLPRVDMFTGIITASGTIQSLTPMGGDLRMRLLATAGLDLTSVAIGDSIAVHGVCLTVVKIQNQDFWVDISNETLACTTLAEKSVADELNLEPALRAGDPLGGHLVSGHIDSTTNLIEIETDGRSSKMLFALPEALSALVAVKGSITIDGVSLTVNEIQSLDNGEAFSVNLIPHTLTNTTLGKLHPENLVNLEIDLLARYLQRQLETQNRGSL